VDLTTATLSRPRLADVAIAGGSWANTRTVDMQLRRGTFRGVRMTGVGFASASVQDVSFVECRIDLSSFRFAKLARVRFERCQMEEIDFSSAQLQSVMFLDCVMVKSLWAEATLTRCEMRGSDISGSGNPERLRGLRMPWQDVLAAAGELAAAVGIEIVE
jgi:uncharacterized protein YjbI with pentapeptide repeats